MEKMSRSISRQEKTSLEDLHWFFAKSKVPICLAVTECDPFLDRFLEAAVLSEEESLVLKADTRSVHRVIYESLCWIEAKNFPLEYIFDNLFQKPFLKLYPKLKPICDEYKQGKYKNGVQSSLDKEQDQVIFAQDKVKICWAITDLFPFIHGLQDLTILSETESLKLQADGRSVSRVIYESLSLIEKKDLHLGVVFEYIFQPCYQTLYPGLQAILQESSADLAGPFNGKQYVEFNNPDSLVEFFELNKSGIAEAINECFPFLNGLHDMGLLAKMELLKLLADKRPPDKVLYEALNWIQQKSYMEVFFTYLFREFYLNRFPDLRIILYKLNKVIALDMCCSVPGSLQDLSPSTQSDSLVLSHRETAVSVPPRRSASPSQNTDPPMRPPCDSLRTHSKLRVSVVRLRSNGEDFSPLMPENKKSPRTPRNQSNNRELESLDEDVKDLVVQQTRKCRLKPICYTELSDNDWEFIGDMKTHAGAKSSLHRRRKQEQHKGTDHQIPIDGLWDITIEQKWIKDAANVAVNLEFPKQIFNDVFNVRCGPKKGIFMKEHWTGDPSNDMCIKCDKKMFTVIMFEKYGGKENHKNWKRSIHCAGIKLEKLFHSGILKMPRKWQKSF